ncbi:MAG: SPOR domain-containing protein [Thiobacillaceae bacterium]
MAKPSKSQPNRRHGHPIFSGLLIGLVAGLALAVGVALWVKGNNPFKSAEPVAPPTSTKPARPASPETAPSFDFYKVLPGDTPATTPRQKDAAPNQPRYYLQAGAFQNAADADNLKARLALLGVEAQIQTSEIADKGVFHRVRIGPLAAMDVVNTTRALLVQNNIATDLVKESPQPQETH